MKKSLAELATAEKAPKKSFGAFKNVDGGQAQIDLEILRKHNVFFATPCYGGMLTDQFFLSMFRVSQDFMKHGINFRINTKKRITCYESKKYPNCNVFRV